MITQSSKDIKVRGVADVVFCFDCTGSMSPCINNVKHNVESLVKGFNGTPNVTLDWRVRAMGYRDFEVDSEPIINTFDFTNDEHVFANTQLTELTATGGGDYEESALDAIWYAVRTSKWRKGCHKVVVLFTDAGTKNVNSHTTSELGVSGDIDYLKQQLQAERIQLFIFAPDDPLYQQLKVVPKSNITLGVDLNSSTNFETLLEALGKTVSASSVDKSVTI